MFKKGMRQALCLSILFLLSGRADAATFVVDSFLDTPDTNLGDGICEATSGGTQCTLRAAIQQANSSAGFDEITFSIPLADISIQATRSPAAVATVSIPKVP